MNIQEAAKKVTSSLLSPKTLAFLKLGAALIGVYHAVREVKDAYKTA